MLCSTSYTKCRVRQVLEREPALHLACDAIRGNPGYEYIVSPFAFKTSRADAPEEDSLKRPAMRVAHRRQSTHDTGKAAQPDPVGMNIVFDNVGGRCWSTIC